MRSRRHLWRKAATAPTHAARMSTTIANSAGCMRKWTNCTVATPGEYRQQRYTTRRVRDAITTTTPHPISTLQLLLLLLLTMTATLLIAQVCPITVPGLRALSSASGANHASVVYLRSSLGLTAKTSYSFESPARCAGRGARMKMIFFSNVGLGLVSEYCNTTLVSII